MQKTILGAAIAAICGLGTSAAMAQQASTSKVELWGIADAAIRHTNNEGENKSGLTKMIGGGMSQSRWGINVEEDLGGGTKALVHLEHRFNLDTGEKNANDPFFQLSYVGLQGPYGRLTMGRQWNVLFDVVSSTYASFPYSPYMDAYKPELGMAAGARSSNSLKYLLATPDRRWVGALQYSFDEGNNTKAVYSENEPLISSPLDSVLNSAQKQKLAEALGAPDWNNVPATVANATAEQLYTQSAYQGLVQSTVKEMVEASTSATAASVAKGATKTIGGLLRYSENGISVGGAYLRTTLPGKTKLDAWTFGGSYRSGPLYINLGYGENKIKRQALDKSSLSSYLDGLIKQSVDSAIINGFWEGQTNGGFQAGDANKRTMYKLGFGYQITPQINAGVHYYHAKQKGSESGASNGKADFIVALANYAFSKRTDAYFGVDHTKVRGGSKMFISDNGARSRTGITVGLRHRF